MVRFTVRVRASGGSSLPVQDLLPFAPLLEPHADGVESPPNIDPQIRIGRLQSLDEGRKASFGRDAR